MNKKRQTVWLVSMLSLMVILSAYYLFTDDVKEPNLATSPSDMEQMLVDATEVNGMNEHSGEPTEEASTDELLNQMAGEQLEGAEVSESAGDEQAATDDEVLAKVQAQGLSGADYFTAIEMEENERLNKEMERWLTIVNDSEKNNEAVSEALRKVEQLEDYELKTNNIEDQLMSTYNQAAVIQENNKWRVVVQADHLQKSEAVTIIDMVAKELNVRPGQIEVQFIQ